MNIATFAESYVRTDDYAARLDGVYLPNAAWAVFAHLDQPISVEEIARRLRTPPESVLEVINLLIENQLARKHLVNWREFLAKNKGSDAPAATEHDRPGTAMAGWPRPSSPASTIDAAPPPPSPQEINEAVAAATAPTPVAPAIEPAPSPRAAAPIRSATPQTGTVTFSLVNEIASRDRRVAEAMTISIRIPGKAVKVGPAVVEKPAQAAPVAVARIAPKQPPAAPKPPAAEQPIAVAPVETKPPAAPEPAPATIAEPAPAAPKPAVEPAPVAPIAAAPAPVPTEVSAVPAPVATPQGESWRLHALLEAITRKGGGGLNGQLLVYRVFLRVPTAMMRAAGIQSLSLVDDSTVIHDRKFYEAICDAARKVASLDLDSLKN